jgi:hypothetical protein
MELTLPKEKSTPSKNLSDYSILMYGEEKIGKTTFAAQFPEAIFLMCEPGSKALSIYSRAVNSWVDMKSYLKLLAKDKKFKTIVIDTVDVAYLLCEKYCAQQLGVDDINDAEYGKGWRKVKAEFKQWMSFAGNLGKGIIYISHATEKEIKNRSGGSRHRTVPTMDRRAADIMEADVDIWAYYHYESDGSRTLQIRGTEEVAAGVRTKQNFLGIEKISGGVSEEETYKNFVSAFENRLEVAKPRLRMKLKKK